jgi:hypothetical protein
VVAEQITIYFFIDKIIDENKIIDKLEVVLDSRIESVNYPKDKIDAMLIIDYFSEGFPLYGYLMFIPNAQIYKTKHQICSEMAVLLGERFMIEVGNEQDEWLLAFPDGSVESVTGVDLQDGMTYKRNNGFA